MKFARGTLVARLLSRSWRRAVVSPPEVSSAELGQILEQLLACGAGALAWRQVRGSLLASTPSGERLHNVYRVQGLRAAGQQRRVAPLIEKFRARGLEPILMKGWSLARLYPEPGLRPFSDVDLIVEPKNTAAAAALLAGGGGMAVDLEHDEITRFDRRPWSDLYRRSRLLDLEGAEVRVLGEEDQLRAHCIHFLKHGGWGPLWLCDIALLVESRTPEFNWDLCLGEDRKQRSWLTCALLLAHVVLGMEVEGVPLESGRARLPRWVWATVLEQWGSPALVYRAPFRSYLRRPTQMKEAIADRWPPNPIVSTLTTGARFGAWPPRLLQAAEVLSRLASCFLPGGAKRE